jgi:hypothetical protein
MISGGTGERRHRLSPCHWKFGFRFVCAGEPECLVSNLRHSGEMDVAQLLWANGMTG